MINQECMAIKRIYKSTQLKRDLSPNLLVMPIECLGFSVQLPRLVIEGNTKSLYLDLLEVRAPDFDIKGTALLP